MNYDYKKDIERIFAEKLARVGAIKKGHFCLSNGSHSDTYFQIARLCQNPKDNNWAATILAMEFGFNNLLQALDVQLIVSPAIGGILVGYELASILELPFVFCEREGGKGPMKLRRGFEIKPNTRVAILEDVVTTASSIYETMLAVEETGAEVVAVASLINRSGRKDEELFNVPYFYLSKVDIKTSKPDECELCKNGITIEKPGSKS